MAAAKPMIMSIVPVVSKNYCSTREIVLGVRRRPNVVNGGGLVVVDVSQKVVFRIDGCGILGKKEKLILRDGDGNELLLIRRKGGIVEALSLSKTWKGYSHDDDLAGSETERLVFSVKEPMKNSCIILKNNPITISTAASKEYLYRNHHREYFEIRGDFSDRNCVILNSNGSVAAQVGVWKEVQQMMMMTGSSSGSDVYHVVVKPGMDQAFVFGVIAVLDYIYDGSTRC